MESEKKTFGNGKTLFLYLQELKDELKRVSWTSQEELRLGTKTVVVSMVFFGMGIYLFDFLIKGSLDSIKSALFFLFG